MSNIPTSLNNPGDLRFVGQENATADPSGFAKFDTPQHGYAALLNDLQAKADGKLKDGSLEDLVKVYAPPSENNTGEYTAYLANKNKIAPTDSWVAAFKKDPMGFANAIATKEGFQGELPNSGQVKGDSTQVQQPDNSGLPVEKLNPGLLNTASAATPTNAVDSIGSGIKNTIVGAAKAIPRGMIALGKAVAPNEVDTLGSAIAGLGNLPAQVKGQISTPTIKGQVKGMGELGTVAAAGLGAGAAGDAATPVAARTIGAVKDLAAKYPKIAGVIGLLAAKKFGETGIGSKIEDTIGIKGLLDHI